VVSFHDSPNQSLRGRIVNFRIVIVRCKNIICFVSALESATHNAFHTIIVVAAFATLEGDERPPPIDHPFTVGFCFHFTTSIWADSHTNNYIALSFYRFSCLRFICSIGRSFSASRLAIFFERGGYKNTVISFRNTNGLVLYISYQMSSMSPAQRNSDSAVARADSINHLSHVLLAH